ncbi:hypothetical protein C8F04DRAFT_1198994 [Mycena alexandri]|uniref:Uncharacterized protein n=1 Tax=Mycena alexandri TaxID=1745969 RepID=A0AAD6S198_9AGAR|nr:hypothetical protein C8F04DRAFT_1198994 [Mycena alexandri]
MFSAKFLLAAAVPALLTLGGEFASPTITACSGTINPPDGCVIISVVSASCINLTGNLTSLNKEISWAQVPDGFVCTFFQVRDCSNGGVNAHDVAVLEGGTWDMSDVQAWVLQLAEGSYHITPSIAAKEFFFSNFVRKIFMQLTH